MLFVQVQPFFEICPVLGADVRRQERNGLFLKSDRLLKTARLGLGQGQSVHVKIIVAAGRATMSTIASPNVLNVRSKNRRCYRCQQPR